MIPFSTFSDMFTFCDIAKPFPVETCWFITQVLRQEQDLLEHLTKEAHSWLK